MQNIMQNINGVENKLIGLENIIEINRLKITINGNNNKIFFSKNISINNLTIVMNGNNNIIRVGKRTKLSGVFNFKEDSNSLLIGDFTTMVNVKAELEYSTSLEIGKDCMFSTGITIRTGDSHSIIDLNTKKRVNFPKSIKIHDHVWVGYGVSISKGVELQNNTVVGAHAYVNKSFTEGNCVVAGVPAQIVKKNIIWDRRSLGNEIPETHIQNLLNNYSWIKTT